jgi:hypothetical protein
MTADEARETLIASLTTVRGRFEADADDWKYSLLCSLRGYCLAIEIDRRLLDPLEKFRFEVVDQIVKERRRAQGKSTKQTPHARALAMTFAAACVTALKKRGEYGSIPVALAAVAQAAGISSKELKSFRGDLYRGCHPAWLTRCEEFALELDTWATPEIMDALKTRVPKFV